MNFNDLAKAHVRTIVPVIVGLVITLALRAGIDLHGYAPFITSATTAAYYSAARLAEHYLDPRFGWLLGVATAPKYALPATKKTDVGHVDLLAVLVVVLIVVVLLVAVGAFR